MTTLRWLNLPFRFTTDANFFQELNLWLSEVFYTTLPEAGYEIREEQIYSCFRIVNAFRKKEALMVEAGSGTGKTFAYLLPALCYARLSGHPVIISCSSSALQEQLISPHGDINTLSNLLNMKINTRLAKDPANYICAVQADLAKLNLPIHPQRSRLIRWLNTTKTGDRKELPDINDDLWAEVAYNEAMDCRHCRRRGYCHQAKARQSLWEVQDFIISSHTLFFHDLWTRRERMQKETRLFRTSISKVPLLPPYSAVILDEGHLIEEPALSNLGVKLSPSTIARIIGVFSSLPLVSEGLLKTLDELDAISAAWFAEIRRAAKPVTDTHGLVDPDLVNSHALTAVLETALDEMAMYQQHDVNSYIQDLELFLNGLMSWQNDESCIAWWDSHEQRFWVLPRDFSRALGRELILQKKPVLFTSATLDVQDNFAYYKRLTGIAAETSQVNSPFNMPGQMKVWMTDRLETPQEKAKRCADLLLCNGGRALVLCKSARELEELRAHLTDIELSFQLFWEDSGDRGWLVERFRQDETSVLIGTSFWEGIDIPGPGLTLVIIYSLPFPAHTPIILVKREQAAFHGENPDLAVDLPAMGIKLRQGIGRLIRSRKDFGAVAILESGESDLKQKLLSLLPPGVQIVSELTALFSKDTA